MGEADKKPVDSRCGRCVSMFCVRFSDRYRWNNDVERTEVLQVTRVFLMSGILSKASTLLMLMIRFILLLALIGSTVANYVVWTDERGMSVEDWFMFPSNWISLGAIAYFLALVYLGIRGKVDYVSSIEDDPPLLSILIWGLYDILLPITTYHFFTQVGEFHRLEISIVLKTTLTTTFFWLECILGAQPYTKWVFTSPALAATLTIGYTAIIARYQGVILYPTLDWIADPAGAVGVAIYAVLAIIFIGMFFYIVMATRNDCIGIKPYRVPSKPGDDPRRKKIWMIQRGGMV